MRIGSIFLFIILSMTVVIFSKIYTLEDLLKFAEINVQYSYMERELVPVDSLKVSSKIDVFPLNDPTSEWNFKLSFFNSLDFFSDVDYYSKKFDFESGIKWSLISRERSKEILKILVNKKIEVINIYFDLLKTRKKIERLKDAIDKTDNMWNSTLPIDYGLSRIEENYLIEKLKMVCGITGDLEISPPTSDVSSLDLNMNSILNTVIYLNKQQKESPELSLVFSLSNNHVNSDFPRLSTGFEFSWENSVPEQNDLSGEVLRVRRLYSQFEYLKDMLGSYQKNLSTLKKDSLEYDNVLKIIEDYTLESFRLYYQLKILEEIAE